MDGVSEMWVCEQCGASFVEPKFVPFYREYFQGCPECNSLLISQDATKCCCCEEWKPDEKMFIVAGICRDCVDDILCERHDILAEWAKEDIDAFAEFAAERLRNEKKLVVGKENAPMCCNT